jgi:tetratricopeptide (TPR) repeat protein
MQAVRKFTDREAARDAFFNAFHAYQNGEIDLRVLMYYGVGGIGKTTLLKKLKKEMAPRAQDQPNLTVVDVNLESAQFETPAACLFAIHNQLEVSCYAFEYALARFWALRGWSLEDIRCQPIEEDSLLFDLVEATADVVGVFAPARLVHRLWDEGNNLVRRWFGENRLLVEEIDGLSEKQVEARLPYYLGLSIEQAAIEKERQFVFFLDSHEVILRRDAFQMGRRSGDEWLREMIGSAENGLYVIAGREYLKWTDYNPEWGNYLEQHILGELTDEDADYFLSSVPVLEPDIRRAIIETAHGVPLYLDLCATTYMIQKQSGERIEEADFRLAERDVVRRFISHLDSEQAEALKVCSLVEQFDYDLFLALMKSLNIHFPATLYKEFCETSYTVTINEEAHIYKIHDCVRGFVSDEMEAHLAYRVLEAILEHCNQAFSLRAAGRISWVYQQAFILLASYNFPLQSQENKRAVKIGLRLIDSGHWKAVASAVNRLPDTRMSSADKSGGIRFLQALCLRKVGRLEEARRLYTDLLELGDALGPWTPLVRFHASHAHHLLGNYDEAFEDYAKLAAIEAQDPISKEAKLLANRQMADISMLRGEFKDALASFKHLAEIEGDALWQAELHRFRGHVYRFNFDLVEGEKQYREALDLSQGVNADAMQGKALTNLAETLCWTAPQTALSFVEEAVELNKQVNAPIEVGKALTAQAIALASMPSRSGEALKIATQAEELQAESGYRSGVLFALQAQGLARAAQGQIERTESVLKHMRALSKELGDIYPYLSMLLSLILHPGEIDPYYRQFQWFDLEKTLCTLRSLSKNFTGELRGE